MSSAIRCTRPLAAIRAFSRCSLPSAPKRLPLLDERLQPLGGVLRLHQFFEIQALDGGQALVEVGVLRQSERALCKSERRSALFVQPLQPLLGAPIELRRREDRVCNSAPVDHFAGQKKFETFSRRHLTRELIGSYRRKDAEVDFGLTESGAIGRENEIARQRELAAAAERRALHQRDRDDVELRQNPEAFVKSLQHRDDTIADVVLHARACGERFLARRADDEAVAVALNFAERAAQLLQNRDVEDVQRRIVERDAIGVRVLGEFDFRHGWDDIIAPAHGAPVSAAPGPTRSRASGRSGCKTSPLVQRHYARVTAKGMTWHAKSAVRTSGP